MTQCQKIAHNHIFWAEGFHRIGKISRETQSEKESEDKDVAEEVTDVDLEGGLEDGREDGIKNGVFEKPAEAEIAEL